MTKAELQAMKPTIILALLLLACPVYAVPPAQSAPKAPVVKLTESGLCHTKSSPYFKRIKRYTEMDSLKACLAVEGTREPKRKKAKGGSK